MSESTNFLCSKTLSDWSRLSESLASCGIEGLGSPYLSKLYNGWLFDHNLNRKELHDLAIFMGYEAKK